MDIAFGYSMLYWTCFTAITGALFLRCAKYAYQASHGVSAIIENRPTGRVFMDEVFFALLA